MAGVQRFCPGSIKPAVLSLDAGKIPNRIREESLRKTRLGQGIGFVADSVTWLGHAASSNAGSNQREPRLPFKGTSTRADAPAEIRLVTRSREGMP